MCSRSNTARCRSGERMALRGPLGPLLHHRTPGLRAHPGVLEHRGQVDVVDVVVPVDDAGVEAERRVVVGVEGVPQRRSGGRPGSGRRSRCRRRRARRSRGPAWPGRGGPRSVPPTRPACPGPASAVISRSATVMSLVGPAQLALHPAPPGERPLGHADRLAPVVVERVAAEPVLGQLDQVAVAQAGSARPRRRGTRVGPSRARAPCAATAEDGGHDQVDRDDVDDALGHAGELAQQAAGVGDDDRLGHAEAADPTRAAARTAPTR